MKILILTTIWKRIDIVKRFYNNLKSLQNHRNDIIIDVVSIVSEKEHFKLAKQYGFHVINCPNKPLGKKWNNGLFHVKNRKFDKLLILGSDNFINPKTLDLYFENKKEDIIAFSDLFLLNLQNKKVKYLNNFNTANKKIGAGMLIDYKIVKACDFKLWNDNKSISLDASLYKKVYSVFPNIRVKHISSDDGAFLCDIKNGVNIHKFESFKTKIYEVDFIKKYCDINTFTNIFNAKIMKKTKLIDIVIPYSTTFNTKENNDLKYALRSIDKNAVFDCRIIIIGDLPEFIDFYKKPDKTNAIKEIEYISHERKGGLQFANCLDVNTKMNKIILNDAISDDFIVSYDDILFTKKTEIEDLNNNYVLDSKKAKNVTNYVQLKRKTVAILVKNNFPYFNFETHLPRLINKSKMILIYKKFKPIANLLLHFTLYGNYFFGNKFPILVNKKSKIKAGFYGADNDFSYNHNQSKAKLKELIKKHQFCNFNDDSLSENLKKSIAEIFPNKISFEK